MNILARQTVDRAKHPTLGEGRAVFDNGPAFFVADSGEVESFKSIGFGGCGKSGSYLRAQRPDGTRIELDTTERQGGDSYWRAADSNGVRGWLVSVARPLDEPRTGFMSRRWEPDGGTPRKLYVTTMEVGPPGALKRSERRKSGNLLPSEEPWFTWMLTEGPQFVWCHERDADNALTQHKPAEQMAMLA
jgi:hypothetical protein